MEWYLKVLRQYADFNGRARRKEYWMFALFNMLICFAILAVAGILGAIADIFAMLGSLVYGLYALAIIVPSIAVAVRRLHDTGRSGWWILIAFVPLVGGIVLLVFLVTEGEPIANQFGENPKAISSSDDFMA